MHEPFLTDESNRWCVVRLTSVFVLNDVELEKAFAGMSPEREAED